MNTAKLHLNKGALLALLLTLCFLFSAVACTTGNAGAETTATPDVSDSADADSTSGSSEESSTDAPVDSTLPVNVMVLNGTTGFGMAKLMQNTAAGSAALNYSFSVEADASTVTAALLNGSVDIAALPTNAAATLYAKSGGKIQLLAINTLGVLYVVANGEKVDLSTGEGIEKLRGKTVYCPAQNPAFIFAALCEKNGLKVGTDIVIDTSYAAAADLRTALVAGQVDLAVLPEPMVTIAEKNNASLSTALDLTAEWDKVFPAGSLAQGCVVVRRAFAEEHSAEVNAFLKEYEASIRFLQENATEAANAVIETGVFSGAAPIAAAAIPNCNVCFVTGEAMKSAMQAFCSAMMEQNPASVGGALPGDDFYYLPVS